MPADTGFPPADMENGFPARPPPSGAVPARRTGCARARRREPDPAVRRGRGRPGRARGMTAQGCRRSAWTPPRAPSIRSRTSTAGSGPPTCGYGSGGERLALARRRDEPIPPIEVYRVGELHFAQHHRVPIAMATGAKTIEAYVTQVLTERRPPASRPAGPAGQELRADLRCPDAAPRRGRQERYRLIMTHEWNDEIIERQRRTIR